MDGRAKVRRHPRRAPATRTIAAAAALSMKTMREPSVGGETIAALPGRQRRCLMCAGQFLSAGPGERICRSCKSSDTWRSGAPFPSELGGWSR
jgi:hypothetical protein